MRALLFILLFAQTSTVSAEESSLTATAVPLGRGTGSDDRVGTLAYLGGLEIESGDPAFGGWSGGVGSADLSEVWLVSDRGLFTSLALQRDPGSGRLLGVEAGALRPLLDQDGKILSSKLDWDAESLVRFGDGSHAVGFEHNHRIWHYDRGLGEAAGQSIGPKALAELPLGALNNGVEALAISPDGRLLIAILEGPGPDGTTRAFLRRDGDWQEQAYRSAEGFGVTDAAFLANGDLLVLERFYSRQSGPKSHIRRIAAVSLEDDIPEGEILASFRRPISVDNFEILLVGAEESGAALILIGSDDNFSERQRFLLLLFRLDVERQ